MSANRKYCTTFEEPSFPDFGDFLTNLQSNIRNATFKEKAKANSLLKQIDDAITTCKLLIKKVVLASVAGKNLARAQGLSIYFPEQKVHSSYTKTAFATNNWVKLIAECVS